MLRASLVQIQREQRGEDTGRDGIKLKLGGGEKKICKAQREGAGGVSSALSSWPS